MNTTTLNMTTLDGGNVIIKRGEGGGATINNQDKVVDITKNGTTEVVADGGYTGLGKVTINTEVSGGGGESGGDWHYFDVSEADLTDPGIAISLIMCYVMVKWTIDDEVGIGAAGIFELVNGFAGPNPPKVLAFGGDYTQRIIFNGIDASYSDLVEELRAVCSFPEITKEEFYSLD